MADDTNNKPRFVGEKVRVSDVFDLRMGKTPSRKNLSYWHDGNHDWISIADLGSFGKYVGSTKERINDLAIAETGIKPAPANTVLMSFKLSLGKTAITTIPVYTNEAIMAFVDKGIYPVDPSFMYHQCRAKDWTADTNTAVMGKTLNKKTLGQQMVFLPGLAEQKAIARQLDFVERQLDNANEQLEQLDSLVKSRFVEITSGALATIKHRKLEELVTIRLGLTHTPLYTDSGKPFLSIKNISGGSICFENCKFISEEEFKSLPIGARPSVGDLLFCRVGTMGKPVIIEEGTPEFGTFVSLGHFKIGPEVNAHFLKAWMESESFNAQVQKHVAGASQPNLNTGWLKQFMAPLPPLALQQEFADFVSQVDKLQFKTQQQIEKLKMLKKSLMQEYFGQ